MKTSYLRQLLHKEVGMDTNDSEFNASKKIVSATSVLTYLNPKKEIILSVDAFKDALGAVIMHDNQPIAFACTTLSES